MDRLRMKAAECKFKENDRSLKEQFISSINDDSVTNETMKELVSIENTSKVTSV